MPEFADCTIVCLAHNARAFTEHCIDSVLAADPLPRQWILVNNGSTDDTADLIADRTAAIRAAGVDFLTWENADNLGCSVARNQAWEKATSKYVVFMDNDAAVRTRSWLARFVAHMEADDTLGVLGPKLVYPYRPHPVQCAGVAINPLGRIRFRGRGAPRDAAEYAVMTEVPALISACWVMRRRFLDEIGGLDELFHPVQYEDLDFCLRVNAAGYHCAYTPDVEVYHFEGITTASFGEAAYARNIVEQSAKFRERWHDVFRTYPNDPADYRWLPREQLGLTPELDLTMVG